MAGIGGVVLAGFGSFGYGTDGEAVILAFVVVCVGGMGSLPGAILGAVLIGLAEAFGILVLPALSLIFVYLVMAIVLVVRPWGLMGRPQV
jgi:branched-chain amino acid transport system permease protein